MDPADAVDHIQEAVEEPDARGNGEGFRTRAAVSIAVLAMLLAIASLGGENATKEMINANIHASDTWAFYQAKNIRQTATQLAADELEITLLIQGPAMGPEAQQHLQQRLDRYKATVARYESEPDPTDPTNPLKGEGKRELLNIARDWEARRDHAQAQDPNFDYSTALYQIAIVLGSVAIISSRRGIFSMALILGAVATVLMVNGYLLLFDLPIG